MTETPMPLSSTLSAAVEKMPAFPKSVQRVLEITRDINCQPQDLVSVIENDPVMTLKLLRILNSAYYSFPHPITSVKQSVVYLGINAIKNMALSFATAGVLPPQNEAGFDTERYLMHSLVTARLAQILCQQYGDDGTDPTDCHLAGLLHDFGKVVFAQFMTAQFKEALALSAEHSVPLHATEKQTIGVDHSVAGAMLVEKWQFPKSVSDSIRYHHSDPSSLTPLQGYLFVADQISKKLLPAYGDIRSVQELPPEMVKHFGGNLDHAIAELGDISSIFIEAETFAKSSSEVMA